MNLENFIKVQPKIYHFFNIDEIFLINKREKLDEIYYYLLTKENSNKLIKNRFLRQEIYSLWQNFM